MYMRMGSGWAPTIVDTHEKITFISTINRKKEEERKEEK